MSISITRAENFSENSFEFEESVGNRFWSEKIGLVAEDGGPLLLRLKDCLAYGINKNNKFGKENFTIALAVGIHKDFISALETVEKKCAAQFGNPGTNVVRCFYRNGKQPDLYAKIDKTWIRWRRSTNISTWTPWSGSQAYTCPQTWYPFSCCFRRRSFWGRERWNLEEASVDLDCSSSPYCLRLLCPIAMVCIPSSQITRLSSFADNPTLLTVSEYIVWW